MNSQSNETLVPSNVCDIPLVIRHFPGRSGDEHLCIVGYAGRRGSGSVNIYYPYADVGMLWFREEGEVLCVSGMLKRKAAPNKEAVWALIDFISTLLGVSEQLAQCIELVEATHVTIENGEESLFFAGDGENGARFA